MNLSDLEQTLVQSGSRHKHVSVKTYISYYNTISPRPSQYPPGIGITYLSRKVISPLGRHLIHQSITYLTDTLANSDFKWLRGYGDPP